MDNEIMMGVYVHYNMDGVPFYVGVTSRTSRPYYRNDRSPLWHLEAHGGYYVEIRCVLPRVQAFEKEAELISLYGLRYKGGSLCNVYTSILSSNHNGKSSFNSDNIVLGEKRFVKYELKGSVTSKKIWFGGLRLTGNYVTSPFPIERTLNEAYRWCSKKIVKYEFDCFKIKDKTIVVRIN